MDSDLAPFLGDLSQTVKVSEIKPPLVLALIMTLRFGHLVGKAIPSQFLTSKGLKRYVFFISDLLNLYTVVIRYL